MKKLFKVLRWIVIVVVVGLVIAQFFGPAKTNPPADPAQAIEARLQVTPAVAAILDRSCNDCHSNKTRWPWYSNLAPVSWFVIDHVNEGRENINFSEWGRYTPRDVDSSLKQMCRETKAGVMPLSSYTPLHPGSKLSADDVKTLCAWTDAERTRCREVILAATLADSYSGEVARVVYAKHAHKTIVAKLKASEAAVCRGDPDGLEIGSIKRAH